MKLCDIMFRLFLVFAACQLFASVQAYYCTRGACRVTSHAFNQAIDVSEITYDDPEIKEWHFHVYFFQENNVSVSAAYYIQSQLLKAVESHQFLVIFDGITTDIVPAINESSIPPINMGPRGPHPCGSFEVWCPTQYESLSLSPSKQKQKRGIDTSPKRALSLL